MTYTLAMASDKGIQIAEDGIAEVSMTDARAHLTPLIRDVRWGDRVAAFTERGERNAYVVKPAYYESMAAERKVHEAARKAHTELVQKLYKLVEDPVLAERMEQLDPDLHLLLTTSGL